MGVLDCFRGDKNIIAQAKSIFLGALTKLASNGKNIDFMAVYKSVLEQQVDIDVQSAALIYEGIKGDAKSLGKDIESHMTSSEELDHIVLGRVAANTKSDDTGIEGQATALAKAIVTSFGNAGYGRTTNDGIGEKIMAAVKDYAKSINKGAKKGKIVDQLKELIEQDAASQKLGGVGEKLFEALKPIVEEIMSKIKDPALRKRFEHDVEKIKEAGFKMGITNAKGSKIINDALKESEFGKPTKNGKIVDWNKLAAEGDLSKTLDRVLGKALDDKGYTGDKQRVYDALIDQYETLRRANSYSNALNEQNINKEKLADEIAISKGFVKPTTGNERVADYGADVSLTELVTEMERMGLMSDGKEVVKNKKTYKTDKEYQAARADAVRRDFKSLTNKYIEKRDYSKIKDTVLRLMAHNNTKYKQKATDLDRLVRLQNQAGLDGATSALAGKILGMRVDMTVATKLNDIVQRFNDMMSNTKDNFEEVKKNNPDFNPDHFNTDHSPVFFASVAHRAIMNDINELMKQAIIADTNAVGKLIYMLGALQRMANESQLSSATNIPQNIMSGVVTMLHSGPYTKIAKMANLKTFRSYMMQDNTGEEARAGVDPEIKGWPEAKGAAEKMLALVKHYAGSVLSIPDGLTYANGSTFGFYKMLYNNLYDVLEAQHSGWKKKDLHKKVVDIMSPYFNEEHTKSAAALADHYLRKAGYSPQTRGQKRFDREVFRDAENIRMAMFMAGDFVSTDKENDNAGGIPIQRAMTAKDISTSLIKTKLGKQSATVNEKIQGVTTKSGRSTINAFSTIMESIQQKQEANFARVLNEARINPTASNRSRLLMTMLTHRYLTGGDLFSLAGASRWADIAAGSALVSGVVNYSGYMWNKKSKVKAAFSNTAKEDGTLYNEEETGQLYKDLELARWRAKTFAFAWGTAALVVGTLAASYKGHDDESWWKKAVHHMQDLTDGSQMWEIMFKRILPLQIRLMYVLNNLTSDDLQKNANEITRTLFTRVPTNFGDMFQNYIKKGKFQWAQVGKNLANAIVPFAGFTNPYGLVAIYNLYKDEKRHSRLKIDFADSPFIEGTPDDPSWYEAALNGAVWGSAGYHLNYAAAAELTNTNGMTLLPDDKRKNFKDIAWTERYHLPKNDERKEQISNVIDNLGGIEQKVLELAKKYHIKEYDNQSSVHHAFMKPRSEAFLVDPSHIDPDDLKKIPKLDKGERANLLKFVIKDMNLDANIGDIETAIEFRAEQRKKL